MELLKTETSGVDAARTTLEDIRIGYIISADEFVLNFKEINQDHVGTNVGSSRTVKMAFVGQKLVYQSGVVPYIEKALDHWLTTPNSRYSPTPKQWMEEVRSLSSMSKDVGKEQARSENEKVKDRLATHVTRTLMPYQDATTELLLNKLIIAESKVSLNGGAEDAVFAKLHYEAVNAMQNVRDHIRLLVREGEERGRKQASDNPIKISETGVADIIARLSAMADLEVRTLGYLKPAELQKKVRDIIVAGIPAVIGRKVAA